VVSNTHARAWLYGRLGLGMALWVGVHVLGLAAEVKDPDKVLRRLQYNYTAEDVAQLKAQSAATFMAQCIEQARNDLQTRASQPQPTVAQLMEQDHQSLLGVQALSPDEATVLRRQNRVWQNEQRDQTVQDSLGFYQTNPNGLAPRYLWFWSNHFNVFGDKGHVRLFLRSYETQAIGAHAFDTFPALLKSAVLHPAMLVYLDNQNNHKGKLNENLAREVLELHTLGEGQGYTQADVQTLAKALTGYTYVKINQPGSDNFCRRAGCLILGNTGAVFEPKLHDTSDKFFMGKLYPGRADGAELLDMLNDIAMSPATAKRISTKLAQYFIGDEFPSALVDHLQKTYLQTGGDLKQVLQTLLTHPAFLQAQQRWVSDPLSHWIGQVRQLRQLGQDLPPKRLVWLLRQTGAPHHGRVTPDGYPLASSAWDSASTLSVRLEAAGALGAEYARPLHQGGPATQPIRRALLETLSAKLGPNSQQILMPYQDNLGRWLSLYFLSPEAVYF
jgi:uncharacterized protein (DUF1800 family)